MSELLHCVVQEVAEEEEEEEGGLLPFSWHFIQFEATRALITFKTQSAQLGDN
jgi:hypothetical protein